jgi:hypothetical protein
MGTGRVFAPKSIGFGDRRINIGFCCAQHTEEITKTRKNESTKRVRSLLLG